MDLPFRIEKKESFRVIGYMIQTTNKKGEGRKAVPSHWARFKAEGLEKPLLELTEQEPQGLFGINIYNTDEADPRKFEYLIAAAGSSDAVSYTHLDVYKRQSIRWVPLLDFMPQGCLTSCFRIR